MAEFQYGKAISDSFKLIFNNVHILMPLLIVNIVNLLFSPIYFKMFDSTGEVDLQFLFSNINFLILIIFIWLISIVLGFIAYGWTFSLIGQLMKKGKADLSAEFKNATKKGWRFFLISLILFLVFFVFVIILLLLIFLGKFITSSALIFGTLLMVLFVIAWLIGLIILILAFMYIVPLLALEDFGALETMKLSYEHFKSNKGHSFALLLISILIVAVPVILMYIVLFAVIGTINNKDLLIYMLQSPVKDSLITFILELPTIVFTVWSFVFLTIAYVKKKKLSKTKLA